MSHETLTARNLSPDEVAGLLHRGEATLVDVREPAEHAAERIAGAVPHPLSTFDPSRLPGGPLVLHCGTGKRSLAALERCDAAERSHVAHLQGGLAAWKADGKPTQRG